MIRFQFTKKRLVRLLLSLVLGLSWGVPAFSVFASATQAAENQGEVLQAEPVNSNAPAATEAAPGPEKAAEETTSILSDEFGQERLLLPYYFSAYIPRLERTEVNLGLFLSQTPGVDVSVSWAALEDIMFSARMSAMGASNTAGLGLRFLALPEKPTSTKPAVALVLNTLFLNHRTLGDPRQNIFRGNRVQGGVVFSKDLGALAFSLQAGDAVQAFMQYFRFHAEALLEYQSGRSGADEAAAGQLEVGAKAALETIVKPGELYVSLVMDTIPDWVDNQNYYLGVRYFSSPDLAFDIITGRLQNGYGLTASISWVF